MIEFQVLSSYLKSSSKSYLRNPLSYICMYPSNLSPLEMRLRNNKSQMKIFNHKLLCLVETLLHLTDINVQF